MSDLHAATEAWLIRMSDGTRFIYGHNAIGDYRAIDPDATVTELVPRAALSAPAVPQWIPVSERLPESGQIVLACYTNRAGNVRRIRAQWVAAKTSEYVGDGDFGEYDEATDTYYDPEGWYECIDNWDDYSAVMVREGDITDWQPLPAAPSAKEPPHV